MQVRKLSAGRKLIAACHSIIEMVEHPNEAATLEDTINIAESTIMAIRDGQARENDMGPKKSRRFYRERLRFWKTGKTAAASREWTRALTT